MKYLAILFIVFSTYCYCEELLGGWTVTQDESMKQELLKQALFNISGEQHYNDIKSKVSNLACKVQVVNGLNIKCDFSINGENWECSYYKSFIEKVDTQLQSCKSEKIEKTSKSDKNMEAKQELAENKQFKRVKISKNDNGDRYDKEESTDIKQSESKQSIRISLEGGDELQLGSLNFDGSTEKTTKSKDHKDGRGRSLFSSEMDDDFKIETDFERAFEDDENWRIR